MRFATWNINSVRTRTERAIDLLRAHDLDVLCLQETKVADDKFPYGIFEDAGYHVTAHGLHQWNGVAIISKTQPTATATSFPGQPGFHKDPEKPQELEARAVMATINNLEIWSLYIPNGREFTDRHYTYKLEFLYQIAHYAESNVNKKLVLAGDFNVAPEDTDVWDINAFRGKTHVSEPERAALAMLHEAGLTQLPHAEPYTYFDYKSFRFQRNEGMKIDFIYTSPSVKTGHTFVDLKERAGDKTSDHAPLITTIDLPDFDSVR